VQVSRPQREQQPRVVGVGAKRTPQVDSTVVRIGGRACRCPGAAIALAGVLLGRETELQRIDSVLERARSGRGGALAIVGEAGIGKTALLAAARERAGGIRIAEAAGVESEADLPFAALGEIAEPFLEHLAELPEPQAQAIGAALALAPPPAAPGDRLAIFAGFLGLLRSAAASQPLLILVDDAHWLDSSSAECLGYVARRLENAPIALLAAARTDQERATLDGRVPDELPVAGLDTASALALLRSSAADLAGPVAEAMVEVAVGNPLALLELPPLLRGEQRRGLAPLDPMPAPGGVLRDAFERRLARLPPKSRAALLVAAASAGRNLGPVIGACAELGIPPDALEQAEADSLISLEDDQLAFSHPLLKGVLYEGAQAAERRRAHRALAHHIEGDARAWHLAAAALGPDEQAAAALEGAGLGATMRGAHSTAADAFERAARASEDREARSRRLLLAGGAAGLAAGYERAAALLEPAAEIDAAEMRARIRHLLALVTLVGGSRPALANSEMLDEEAGCIAGPDPALAALLYADASLMAVVGGDCVRALACAERAARALPDDALEATRCHVLAMLGMALALRGRAGEARDALDRAGKLLPHAHPLSPSTQSISFALHARICTGQQRALREEALSLGSTGRDAGTVGLLPHYLLVAADAAYRLGEWAAARQDVDEAIAIAEESGQRGPLSIALVVRARLHAALGDEAEARAAAARGIEVAQPPRYGATAIWARAALGFLELGLGRSAAAIAELEEAGRLAGAAGLEDPLIVPWAPDLVEAYARAGRRDEARRAAASFAERSRATGVPLARALAERCVGEVCAGAFAERFEHAIELHREADAPFELARTLLAFGSRLHRARRRVEARKRLRAALELFESLGARPWAERTRAELRAAGAIRRAPAADPDELTAQELRVARAVARGATNREVAAELFLSPKTIEFHLGRVYRKLRIRSRMELATLAAKGRLDGADEPG
jgi:DNA-binding CsgD family transcriptional regulator